MAPKSFEIGLKWPNNDPKWYLNILGPFLKHSKKIDFFDYPAWGRRVFVLKSLRAYNCLNCKCSKIANFATLVLAIFLVLDEVINCPRRDFGGQGAISHGDKSILLEIAFTLYFPYSEEAQ